MVSSALPTVSAKVIVVVVFEELAFDEDIAAVVTPGLDASCCDKPVKIRDFYSIIIQIYCTILSNSTLNISSGWQKCLEGLYKCDSLSIKLRAAAIKNLCRLF